MKAARLHDYADGVLRLDDVPTPEITGPHDVIVRIGGAGVCRTDLHVIETVWRDTLNPVLPYTLGHENAGWVEEVGSAVSSVRPGDAVIVHPLITCGVCAGCRRGEDMYCTNSQFPGLNADGGFAEYLKTSERSVVRLAEGLAPADVAPFADAGITAYRAVKKAAGSLPAGTRTAIVGAGGLGHIAIQALKALSPTEVIVVDTSESALGLAKELGAEHVVNANDDPVEQVLDLSGGTGIEAVIDFVGEHGTTEQGPAMLAQGGSYYVVGYGGRVDLPALKIIFSEINVVGNLVGNYTELSELMALAAVGKVQLHSQVYGLDQVNDALADLAAGRVQGRAVLVP
ncbi:NAD(P)-dependent alcohol dehydrogenase [Lentzea sp. NPDC051838]|uniref:NAD(P)-dependent alcohol dehydrogenase n=1 Tax=Lentzea sp. NPDC051838 TaxID=3154849 RepID=UPI0034391A7C